MKLFSRLPLIAFFLLGLSLVSLAQDKTVDPKDVAELKKIYKEFDESGKKRDLKTVEKYLDRDYELRDGEKTYNRAEVIQKVKEMFAMTEEITEVVTTIEKAEVADGNYFLQVSSVMKGKLKLPDGKIAPFETTSQSTDIWMKTGNGWRENTQIVRRSKLFVDGKEVPM